MILSMAVYTVQFIPSLDLMQIELRWPAEATPTTFCRLNTLLIRRMLSLPVWSYCFTSVATETCGQLSPLKFSKTVWLY